jgi:aminoglycoside 6'-N-acetyltransferase I
MKIVAELIDMEIVIRNIQPSDAGQWEALRRLLWPGDDEGHSVEIAAFFAGRLEEPQEVIIAENKSGEMLAFAELSIRYDIPGLEQRRTGYVEGLYVDTRFRNQGLVRKLLQAARKWGTDQHCMAFASDRAERLIVDPTFRSAH